MIKISELKLGDRVADRAGRFGVITGFCYLLVETTDQFGVQSSRWVVEGTSTSNRESFDVLWDNGSKSFNCILDPSYHILSYEDLVKEHRRLDDIEIDLLNEFDRRLMQYKNVITSKVDSFLEAALTDWCKAVLSGKVPITRQDIKESVVVFVEKELEDLTEKNHP